VLGEVFDRIKLRDVYPVEYFAYTTQLVEFLSFKVHQMGSRTL